MNIVLYGAPGCGKGTQTTILSKYFEVKSISLGDILREEVKHNTGLGNEVKGYMEKGLLVPDELVSRVIERNIDTKGFILDGYPRNLSQAMVLDKILEKNGQDIDGFLYFDVDEELIVERLSKRRVCKKCGANYHLKNMPPKNEGICDLCGEKIVQRKDDTPEVIKKRWEIFLKESRSLLDFYQKKNKLIKIDGRGNKDDVFDRIKKKFNATNIDAR